MKAAARPEKPQLIVLEVNQLEKCKDLREITELMKEMQIVKIIKVENKMLRDRYKCYKNTIKEKLAELKKSHLIPASILAFHGTRKLCEQSETTCTLSEDCALCSIL